MNDAYFSTKGKKISAKKIYRVKISPMMAPAWDILKWTSDKIMAHPLPENSDFKFPFVRGFWCDQLTSDIYFLKCTFLKYFKFKKYSMVYYLCWIIY